ncbi:MAG: hypothetical protein C5B47_00450 [Verrucomicrobia bacterium]|nr:MAG: hypothetical protein C5B47_00450 [Verrucomicrobiota bacterium]
MSQFSLSKFGENLPVTGIVAVSQAAVGLALGLLLAEKMGRSARVRTAIALMGAGAAALIPTVAGIANRVATSRPSTRHMQRRLDSIRGDFGISSGS